MTDPRPVPDWEQDLRDHLGAAPSPDFARWQTQHAEAAAHLNPVVTRLKLRRRRFLMRSFKAVAAVAVCAVLVWLVNPQQPTYAQTAERIAQAETITWKMTIFERRWSADGNRTWIRTSSQVTSYRAPDLFHTTRYDENGTISLIEITHAAANRTLQLFPEQRKAVWTDHPLMQVHPGNPFADLSQTLRRMNLEHRGQETLHGRAANVLRSYKVLPDGQRRFNEYLFDVESKELVEIRAPNYEEDLLNLPDKNNPSEERVSKGAMVGGIQNEFQFNDSLDPRQFEFVIPEGYAVTENFVPFPTEAEGREWLKACAEFNDNVFPDSLIHEFDPAKYDIAAKKKSSDLTPVESRLFELFRRWHLNGQSYPFAASVEQVAVPGTFTYIGKGVKLGDASRIVCWYKLKETGKYRAIYGDLSVKDVQPADLPLPVAD